MGDTDVGLSVVGAWVATGAWDEGDSVLGECVVGVTVTGA